MDKYLTQFGPARLMPGSCAGIWEVEGLFLVGIAERESLYEDSWLRGAETPSPENIA